MEKCYISPRQLHVSVYALIFLLLWMHRMAFCVQLQHVMSTRWCNFIFHTHCSSSLCLYLYMRSSFSRTLTSHSLPPFSFCLFLFLSHFEINSCSHDTMCMVSLVVAASTTTKTQSLWWEKLKRRDAKRIWRIYGNK